MIFKIYFGLNIFMAGYYFADAYEWREGTKGKILSIFYCFLLMCFGCIFVLLSYFMDGIDMFWNWLDGTFQISFWFTYYFTKKWDNLEKHQLDTANRIAINVKNKNTIKDRIYRQCTKLVNKRNNYTYTPPTEPPF